jgi:hypothetical protein
MRGRYGLQQDFEIQGHVEELSGEGARQHGKIFK